MAGIFGLIDLSGSGRGRDVRDPANRIGAMAEAMRHEPSLVERRIHNGEMGVYLGWMGSLEEERMLGPVERRMEGLTAFVAGNPERGDVSIGRDSEKISPGAHAVYLYENGTGSFPDALKGFLSGCLVDEKRHTCLLFTDRIGLERIFYYETADEFVFASEAKAILAAVPETRAFDLQGLGQFFSCGCTFGETSLYRNVGVLPGGSVLTWKKRAPARRSKYFDPSTWESLEPLEENAFLEALCAELKSTVGASARRPMQTAVSLTGGLDSRMIMACLAAPEGTVPCYSFGSMYRETYDVKVARKVAERCRQPHHVLVLGDDFLKNIAHYLNRAVFISDGYLGLSGAAELYVNGLAKQVAPGRLTGNYGGELLRGVRAFKSTSPKGGFLKAEMQSRVQSVIREFTRFSDKRPESFTLFVQVPAGYGRYAIERSQVVIRSPFLDEKVISLIYRRPPRFTDGYDPSSRVIGLCRPELSTIPTDRGLLGTGRGPLRALLHLYREALFRLEYWTGQGLPDGLSRMSWLGAGVAYETLFRGRHKFQHFRTWMRNEIAPYVDAVLSGEEPSSLRAVIDAARVRDMFIEHRAGRRNFTEELDRVLTLVLAEKLLLKNRTQRAPHGGVTPVQVPAAPGTR